MVNFSRLCYDIKVAHYIDNRKARFNYEITETMTAGIELIGLEVKSIRNGQGSLESSFVTIRGGEAYLIGAHIPPYQPNNKTHGHYDPDQNRKLILTKKEIARLAHIEMGKNLTIVPLSMFGAGRKIKIDIAIARGKKKFDKRETIKKREADREIERIMKM